MASVNGCGQLLPSHPNPKQGHCRSSLIYCLFKPWLLESLVILSCLLVVYVVCKMRVKIDAFSTATQIYLRVQIKGPEPEP